MLYEPPRLAAHSRRLLDMAGISTVVKSADHPPSFTSMSNGHTSQCVSVTLVSVPVTGTLAGTAVTYLPPQLQAVPWPVLITAVH
jgi:hypothetical protein